MGELLIQGCGVALGYNKLPEQTAKAFIEFNGERTYRSGDYAKWTTDGDVIILGRTDNQVKLRGLRIELGEIEKCLTAVDGIKSGIALIRKVGKADAICVYYTADRQIEPNEIKSELAKLSRIIWFRAHMFSLTNASHTKWQGQHKGSSRT